MFQGRVSTVDNVGRTQATVTVASDLVILDTTCRATSIRRHASTRSTTRAAASSRGTYRGERDRGRGLDVESDHDFTRRAAQHAQGSLVFTSGANANVRATVKSVAVGSALNLMYPLPFAPTAGDAFTVYAGCDHTQGDLPGPVQQPRQLPRLPLRPAAADGVLKTTLAKGEREG